MATRDVNKQVTVLRPRGQTSESVAATQSPSMRPLSEYIERLGTRFEARRPITLVLGPWRQSVRRAGTCLKPRSTLAAAAALADPTPLRFLLFYGTDLDTLALFYSTAGRSRNKNGTATTKVPIEHGIDVNYDSPRWSTPLIHCARYNAKDKLLLLLKHGADPTIRNPVRDMSPAESAEYYENTELCNILKAAKVEWISSHVE
ncbi:conserved hypothetical protein [Pyrenophora tritici-repentis Pt-1C-BFP]|uniref:Uncharacterized protein n=1 Tax=Pyrenophora tritici-repentis (strain Pt-1C-BFP) TaxID=426418 RepID=B2VWT2_PYRTR|nr:uncharacterized protein PTRG_01644 [Pyrenophora tritici-repentis Pt-1C-BFP]EDU41082.1 conserved hypothetical protein [Pyrenophora tritici-repentis Pt-1C-BFP]